MTSTETVVVQPPLEDWLHSAINPSGLDVLRDLVARSIGADAGGDDSLLCRVVSESIAAFIDHGGDPVIAARHVGPLLWEVGDRHARRDRGQRALDVSFRHVEGVVLRGLQFVMSRQATGQQPLQLRAALSTYVRCLYGQAIIGWERARVIGTTDPANCFTVISVSADSVSDRLERPSDPWRLTSLAELGFVDLDEPHRAVVTTAQTLGESMLAHPGALTADDCSEVLVPATYMAEHIDDLLENQAVVGPAVPLGEVRESAQLAFRAAELLRDGFATDHRMAVPCEDLTATLMIGADPQLIDLVVMKHLRPLSAMGPRRRANGAELLLASLSSGEPLAQVARSLGIPVQTAHSRMKVIRDQLGDAIDDPGSRLELIVGLSAVLPLWRAEAPGPKA